MAHELCGIGDPIKTRLLAINTCFAEPGLLSDFKRTSEIDEIICAYDGVVILLIQSIDCTQISHAFTYDHLHEWLMCTADENTKKLLMTLIECAMHAFHLPTTGVFHSIQEHSRNCTADALAELLRTRSATAAPPDLLQSLTCTIQVTLKGEKDSISWFVLQQCNQSCGQRVHPIGPKISADGPKVYLQNYDYNEKGWWKRPRQAIVYDTTQNRWVIFVCFTCVVC